VGASFLSSTPSRTCPLPGDFGHAAGAGRDAESEPVQLDGRVDQAEPEAEPRGATALVATIKPSTHKVAFAGGNSRSGIADTSDDLVLPAMQAGFDAASLRREFHGVVDKVGDRLEQEIAIAVYNHVLFRPENSLWRMRPSMTKTIGSTALARSYGDCDGGFGACAAAV
jgi:hypothetical protein